MHKELFEEIEWGNNAKQDNTLSLSISCHTTVRTRLNLLQPSTEDHVQRAQDRQKTNHDYASRSRDFDSGNTAVLVKNFGKGPTWLAGKIYEKTGPVSYAIQLPDGLLLKRHQDHMRIRSCEEDKPGNMENMNMDPYPMTFTPSTDPPEQTAEHVDPPEPTAEHVDLPEQQPPETPPTPMPIRHSLRARKAPDRLNL